MNNYIDSAEKNLVKTYNRFQIVLEKGNGVKLYDIDGKEYLDFTSGIGVNALGYSNEKYKNALKTQIDSLMHISNLYYSVPGAIAAEKFVKASKMDKVFFTNSGTEAVEGALKAARKCFYKEGEVNSKYEFIAMKHSFHGRSIGAVSVTATEKYRAPFEPLLPGVKFAEFNDLESVKSLVGEHTCGIILEPVQGEGGVYPASKEFLEGIRKLCDEKDIILIFDEVQCGMGRTGNMFAWHEYEVKPDILVSAKALGCGVPVGAFAISEKIVEKTLKPGDHGTTYGGNPFVCQAVSTVFDIFEEEKIIDHVIEMGNYLEEKLNVLSDKYDEIVDVRGKGLIRGIEFKEPVSALVTKMIESGVLVISAGEKVLRILPPLIIQKADIDQMAEILEKCLK